MKHRETKSMMEPQTFMQALRDIMRTTGTIIAAEMTAAAWVFWLVVMPVSNMDTIPPNALNQGASAHVRISAVHKASSETVRIARKPDGSYEIHARAIRLP